MSQVSQMFAPTKIEAKPAPEGFSLNLSPIFAPAQSSPYFKPDVYLKILPEVLSDQIFKKEKIEIKGGYSYQDPGRFNCSIYNENGARLEGYTYNAGYFVKAKEIKLARLSAVDALLTSYYQANPETAIVKILDMLDCTASAIYSTKAKIGRPLESFDSFALNMFGSLFFGLEEVED